MGHDILVIDCFVFLLKKANLDLIFTYFYFNVLVHWIDPTAQFVRSVWGESRLQNLRGRIFWDKSLKNGEQIAKEGLNILRKIVFITTSNILLYEVQNKF